MASAVREPTPGIVSNNRTCSLALAISSNLASNWATNSSTWPYSIRAKCSRPRQIFSALHSGNGRAYSPMACRPRLAQALAPTGAPNPWPTRMARMRFWIDTRRPTNFCRVAIKARHSRVVFGGMDTSGNWPRANSCARRKASSRSVLRFVCLNFQASLAVLATWQGRPTMSQKSFTQPAKLQASMTTAAGWTSSSRRCRYERTVGTERNSAWALAC